MLLTIFTPVYNRAYIISQLYESLCRQSSRDFEWLVVDDGSTDNIDELMNRFISESKINIRYFKQPNGGKHRAINRGVREARGELFFIVDSDDYLADNAVEWTIAESRNIFQNNAFVGIAGIRITPDGKKIGGGDTFDPIDADAVTIRDKYHITGDLAEIYKTSVMKQYPFPDIQGEAFCSEGLIWNRMSIDRLKIRYCHSPIYICEYRSDGLTAGRTQCLVNSPEYSMLLYSESLVNPANSLRSTIKNAIQFWRYSKKSKKNFFQKLSMIPARYGIFIIPGLLFRLLDK